MESPQVQDSEYAHHEIINKGNGRTMGFKFQLNFLVPRQFHSKIRYAKGDTKKWLDGRTKIELPPGGSKKVSVKGDSEEEVIETKQRIIKFISDLTSSRLTHFLSVVFTTDEIKHNFATFRDEIISESELHKSLFQKPEKLHVTLIMLPLPNEEQMNKARECLASCKEAIIDPVLKGQALEVTISGVSIFSDEKPRAAHIVFGNVVSEELQQIANRIAKHFADQGLIKPSDKDVVLHLTMINTTFYTPDKVADQEHPGRSGGTFRPPHKRHGKFDASKILEKYKDYKFGTLTVKEIQINQIGSKGEDGFYLSIGSLQF